MAKFKVTLTQDERNELQSMVKTGKAAARKINHARRHLGRVAIGPPWPLDAARDHARRRPEKPWHRIPFDQRRGDRHNVCFRRADFQHLFGVGSVRTTTDPGTHQSRSGRRTSSWPQRWASEDHGQRNQGRACQKAACGQERGDRRHLQYAEDFTIDVLSVRAAVRASVSFAGRFTACVTRDDLLGLPVAGLTPSARVGVRHLRRVRCQETNLHLAPWVLDSRS